MSETPDQAAKVDAEPHVVTAAKFQQFLEAKCHCAHCGSRNVEAFTETDPDGSNERLGYFSLPDTRLNKFLPVLPFVCGDCGYIGMFWTAKVVEWVEQNG